jgi:Protein of unknown function (DUF1566)
MLCSRRVSPVIGTIVRSHQAPIGSGRSRKPRAIACRAVPDGKPTYWGEAVRFAKNLRLGGYSDWRLPTIEELEELYDPRSGNENNIRGPFLLTSSSVWSSKRMARRGGTSTSRTGGAPSPVISWVFLASTRTPCVCVASKNEVNN